MNDKLQQLYDLYKQKGIISTTDFNTFASASDDQRQKLYDLGVQKGLFNTTDYNTFNTAWGGQEPVKKKESTELASKSGKPTSGSSSRRFEGVTEEPISQKKVRTDDYIDQVQNAKTQPKQTKTVVANTFVPNATEQTVDVLTTDEANKMMAEDFGKKEFELYSKISDIDPNVFGKGKESTVDYLNNKFKGSGFVFEKGVTGESGNSIVIKSTLNDGLGTVVNEKVVQLPTERALSIGGFNEEEAKNAQKEISDFMNQAFLKKSEKEFLNEDVKDYGQLVKLAVTNPQKYGESFLNQYDTEKWIDKQYIGLVTEGKSIKREQQLLEQEIKAYQDSGVFNEETERMIKGRAANLQNQVTANTQKYEEMKDITAKLPQAAAVYFQKKEKEGNLAGLVSGSFFGGLLNPSKMLITTAADVVPMILPSEAMIPEVQQVRLKAAGMTDAQIKDYAAKQLRKGVVKDALKAVDDLVSFGTTEEYVQSGDRNDLEKVAGFLSESIGTAFSAGGNKALQSIAFFSQSYNAIEEEMNSPEFDGLTQMEKKLMSVPYGLVIGQLDKLGFNISKNVAKSPLFNKLVTNTIARAFTSVPKDASIDVMQKAIESSLTATMARAGLNIVGGSLVEGTTEGTQSLTEYTMKNIYNNIVADKDVFQNVPDITTKEGFDKALSAAGEEFYYGALGGAIMGAGGTAIESLTSGFNKGEKEFDFFEKVINDPNLRSLIQTDIKTKITSGELTKAEAYEQIDAINKSVSILNSMPSELPVESKREAYNLILERNKIEKQIEGKDPNLVAAQTERVKEINEQLKGLSYAVQEQGADAVPVQSGAGVGTEMEEGKPATEPQVVTGETITEEVEVEGTKAEQPQAEVAQEEVAQPTEEDNSFVYKMNTEKTSKGKGKWEDDFEIIDNRNGLELGEEASKWAVVNKVTGETVEAKSKKDAQDIIKNAPAYGDMFGEGMTVDFTELNEQVQNNYREQFNQQKTKAKAEVVQPVVQETVQAEPTAKIETIEVQEVPQVEQSLDDLTQQNNVLTQNDFTAARVRNVGKEKVVAQVARAAKAIAKVLPKVKIVVHATPEAFVEATKDMDGRLSEGGLYDRKTGQIHINLEKATNRTVPHEVFHALILSRVNTDLDAQKLTRSMIGAVRKSLKKAEGTAELMSYLEDFESNYDENIKNEEKLAELFAILADNYKQLPPASKNIIIRFLNRLSKAIGLKEMTDREAIQFMNTLSRKVETGQEIEAREVGKQKEGEAAVRKQIIGEVGAKKLDQGEKSTLRMDNLEVAKRMKDAGKTPKEIRIETGWEMGAEGKWRYETVDNLPFFQDTVSIVKKLQDEESIQYGMDLPANAVLPDELLKMYPELNDYRFDFGQGNENEGNLDLDIKKITVNIGNNQIQTVRTLLHEVQHAIQEIEGFDSGTSAQKIIDDFIAQDNAFKNRINRIRKNSPDSPLLDAVRNQRKAFIDNFSTVNKNNEKILNGFNLYMRKAGEIEARNVEARMNMTADERRNTLLTETEDVKDRQIIETAPRKFAVRKQKTTSPDKIVDSGTKAGKTDAEIRQEGKAAGFTNKEMTEALSKYYTKEQKVFMKSGVKGLVGRFVDGARRFKQQFLTSKGLLPKIGFTYKEKMEGEISAEANRAAKTAKKFGVLFDKFTGDKELLKDAFDKALRGDKSIQLPAGFAGLANEMRNHIDRLSQMLIATGAVEGDMADAIRENMGTYITRSYEIFDNKNFRQKVGEQELQAAKNFLRTQPGMIALAQSEAARTGTTVDEALDVLVDNKIDEYFADAETGALVKGSKLGSKDLSTLKERKEIPEQIRMLMGEYSDPAMNYARTVLNIASLAARHKFLTQVKEAGMGKFFFEKNDSQRPKGFDTEIAAEGSDTMSPLNGLMTTPEIAEAFGLYNGQQGEESWVQKGIKIYYKAMGLVKWLKTIASVSTHMKNVISNFGFVGVNGHSLIEIGKAANVVLQDLKTMSKPEIEAKIDEYIKAGIMRQGAGINEIRDMFKDADMDNFLERRLSLRKPNKGVVGKIKQAISSRGSKIISLAEDLYQAEDDMFKIAAYETEMNRYADALYNKSKDQLTDKQKEEVSDIAANNVKNTYPTYSRIPEGIKRLRRFPLFIGSFISFQAESYRTAYNTIALAKDELSSDNKKIKTIAARRIAGAGAYLTAKTALLSYAGYAAGTGLSGVLGALFNDDDEEKKEKDVRSFLPPWSKNSDLIILKAADGEIEYIDFSASDPHGGINKALNAFFNGEDMLDSFKQSTLELVGQFQGPDILTNLAIQLKGNENDFGKPIYNEEDSFAEKTDKILDYVYKVVEPGTITSARKAAFSEQSLGQLAFGEATGLKIRKSDVKEQFGYKLAEFDESFKDIRKIYNSEYYKNERLLEDSKATNKDINEQQKKTDDAYVRANEQYAAKAKELMDLINSANRLGVDYDELIDQLESIKSTMGKSNIYEMEDGGTEFIKEK